jgi:hypothetical protein
MDSGVPVIESGQVSVSGALAEQFGVQEIVQGTIAGLILGNDPGDLSSGDVTIPLFLQVPVGTQVDSGLGLTVTGRPFKGTLAHLAGAKVTVSPVAYGKDGSAGPVGAQSAYIVDFGVSLSVLNLDMIDPDGTGGIPGIVLVLPWLGTDFSPKAAFGGPPGSPPLPVPVPSSSRSVGLPGIETTKLLVQVDTKLDAPLFAAHCRIALATYPASVKASLNNRLPFWTKPGPLRDSQPAAGFAQELNALLRSLASASDVTLQLTSDVPGVLGITGWPPQATSVVHTAAAQWGGQATTQVALAALDSQPVTIPFPVAAQVLVKDLALQLSGAFPPWRSYPAQTSEAPGDLGLTVDANLSVARRLAIGGATTLYGMSLGLRTPIADAQIRLEIQPDSGGLPASGKPIVAANLTVPAGDAAVGSIAWTEVLFPSPTAVAAGKDVWLVAKAQTGTAELVAAPEPLAEETHTVVATEGGTWDEYPPVAAGAGQEPLVPVAQLRVLRKPFASENIPLLDLAWAAPAGATVQAEAGPATAQVDMGAPVAGAPLASVGGHIQIVVSITARSSGILSFKGATVTYQDADA